MHTIINHISYNLNVWPIVGYHLPVDYKTVVFMSHKVLAEVAERSDLQERMNDMISFLDEMPEALTEYSDAVTRRLVEKITIYDEKIVVELKSGLQMEVEA